MGTIRYVHANLNLIYREMANVTKSETRGVISREEAYRELLELCEKMIATKIEPHPELDLGVNRVKAHLAKNGMTK